MSHRLMLLCALGALSGCCAPGKAPVSRLSEGATAQVYFEELVVYTGGATVTECRMFDGSRKGRCLIKGAPEQVRALGDKLEYAPAMHFRAAYGKDTCMLEPGFDVPAGTGTARSKGTIVLARPPLDRWHAGPWPHNTNNVLPGTLFVRESSGEACFEFNYPYG